jgi:hypothetical protein
MFSPVRPFFLRSRPGVSLRSPNKLGSATKEQGDPYVLGIRLARITARSPRTHLASASKPASVSQLS